jgi:hypothetical protein
MSLNCAILSERRRVEFHGAEIGDWVLWAGSARGLRVFGNQSPRWTVAACVVGPTSVQIALRAVIMRFDLSKSSQICVINQSKLVSIKLG